MREGTRQNHLWLLPAAFFIGNCNVFEANPLAAGFFAAVCLKNETVLLTYGGLLLGLTLHFSMQTVLRYAVVMALTASVLLARRWPTLRREPIAASFLAGGISVLVNITVYAVYPQMFSQIGTAAGAALEISTLVTVFLDGLIVFSVALVYYFAIKVITDDFARIATENEAAISAMALAASVLYGMPKADVGGFVIAETFGLFSVLFALYVFGYGLGMAWTVMAGLVRAGTTGEMSYLTGWVITAMLISVLHSLLQCGRIAYAVLFGCVYALTGVYAFPVLLTADGMKAVCAALFLFLLLPKTVVLRVESRVTKEHVMKNSAAWGTLVMQRVQNFAAVMKRIDYTLAGNANIGIGFADLGTMLDSFTGSVSQAVPIKKTMEARLIEQLAAKQLQVTDFMLAKNKDARFAVYLTLRAKKHRMVTAEVIRRIVEHETGLSLMLTEESRRVVGAENTLICLQEKPLFVCRTAVRKLSRYKEEISGDNFYIGEVAPGKMLIMVADGMGNGRQASLDSSTLLEALEELLSAGFDQTMAIRIVNAYLAEANRGERFATLDLLLLDLYTGYGTIYKQGAATTYIKRGDWMELVKSTSLPIGVIDGAICEQCTKKFYNRDIVVLVSDGVLESIIFENKEDYLRTLLAEAQTDEPEELVAYIVREIQGMSGNRLQDDATVVACKLVKTL